MRKVFSFGGGVQSTAALVLAAQGRIDYQTFLFCNVGEDSENPATLAYVRDVARPFAASHGLDLIELRKTRFGEPETLYQRLTRPGSRAIGIPVRMSNSGAPGNRTCTADFKIRVVDKWLREAGAKQTGAQVGLGISLDEIHRVKPNMDLDTMAWKTNVFPLLDEVPRPLTRQDCRNVISAAGLPVPPKSSCWFCPYHSLTTWQQMRQQHPDRFWRAVDLEKLLNERRVSLGLDPIWLTDRLRPLDQATHEYHQGGLFEDAEDAEDAVDVCESGYCMV